MAQWAIGCGNFHRYILIFSNCFVPTHSIYRLHTNLQFQREGVVVSEQAPCSHKTGPVSFEYCQVFLFSLQRPIPSLARRLNPSTWKGLFHHQVLVQHSAERTRLTRLTGLVSGKQHGKKYIINIDTKIHSEIQ